MNTYAGSDPTTVTANRLMQRFERMRSERTEFEPDWEWIAKYFSPTRAKFWDESFSRNDVMDWKFTGDGERYSTQMAESFTSYCLPRETPFFELKYKDLNVPDDSEEVRFATELRDALYDTVTASYTKFYEHVPEVIRDFFDFGIGTLYEEDTSGFADLRYRRWGLHSVYLDADQHGNHTAIGRKYRLTAEQAHASFGSRISPRVQGQLRTDPQARGEYIHFIQKEGDRWHNYHVCLETKSVLSQKTSRTSQVYTPRAHTDPDTPYAHGIGFYALDDMDRLNDIEGDVHGASQLNLYPPLLAENEEHLRDGYLNSRQIVTTNFENGRPLLAPLNVGGNFVFTVEHAERQSNKVGSRYLSEIWDLTQEKGVTATQFSEAREMYDSVLSPWFSKLTGQLFDPILISALMRMHAAEKSYWESRMPDAVRQNGGFSSLEIRHTSPMAGSVKVRQGMAIQQSVSAMGEFAQSSGDPSVFDNVDQDKLAGKVVQSFNAPLDILRTKEDVANIRAERSRQQQEQMQVENAANVAKAMKEVSTIGDAGR